MNNADRLFERYMKRTGHWNRPVDGVLQFQHTYILDVLRRLEVILDDEGVSPETATRVMRGVLYGAPGEAEAELRIQQQEAMIREMSKQSPPRLVRDEYGQLVPQDSKR